MSNCMRLDREGKNSALASFPFVSMARASFDTNKNGSNLSHGSLRVCLDAKRRVKNK